MSAAIPDDHPTRSPPAHDRGLFASLWNRFLRIEKECAAGLALMQWHFRPRRAGSLGQPGPWFLPWSAARRRPGSWLRTRRGGRMPRLTVLGSLNMDISVAVPRLPAPGETVLGSAAVIAPGGKGANQAVAAARLGAAVRMIGCTGDDDFGRMARSALRGRGRRRRAGCARWPASVTGLALITVDAAGENVDHGGSRGQRPGRPGRDRRRAVARRDLLVLSAEIPAGVLATVLAGARAAGRGLPAQPGAGPARGPPRLLAGGVDWLVVNESEAAAVLGPRRDRPGRGGRRRAGPVRASAPGTRSSRPGHRAPRWRARARTRSFPRSAWTAWTASARATRSWPRWPWPLAAGVPAAVAVRRRGRGRAPPRPPAAAPRTRCRARRTSSPPPA